MKLVHKQTLSRLSLYRESQKGNLLTTVHQLVAISRLDRSISKSITPSSLQPPLSLTNFWLSTVANVSAMAPDPQQAAATDDHVETSAPSTSALTHRTKEDFKKILIDQYVNRDLVHSAAILKNFEDQRDQYLRMTAETAEYKKVRTEYRQFFPPSRLFGQGYNGYGNGHTDGQTRLLYPGAKPRPGHKKTARLRIKRKELNSQADQHEELVPIRIDVDWEKIKFRDTFTWNLHDRTVPLDLFAAQLVEDFGLALPMANPVQEQIQHQLHEQLNDFFPPVYIEEDALDPELPYSAYKNDEMRILIRLNITIGPHTLEDKFEWEINNPLNSPEEFAQSMSRELSLSGEFTTAIAHCIREQSQLFIRSLYIVGHPFDGRPLDDADLISSMLPSPLPSVFRPQQQAREYAPYLYEMSEADLERSEVIYSREQRRQKRSINRRGGPTLPDLKDRQRTVRTLIVSSVIPGAAEMVETSRLYKRVGGAGRGKRPGVARDGDISDSDDSEDSVPESPHFSQLQGTARTRTMRGAAASAQQRMANLGRSETPEATILHHHETRTSARRFGGAAREDSPEEFTKIVKLKLPKERYRKLLRELKAGIRPTNLQSTPSLNRAQSGIGTPAPGAMGPPSTPGHQNQQLAPSTTPVPAGQIGRVDAPPPPPLGAPQHVPVSLYPPHPFALSIQDPQKLTFAACPSSMANTRPHRSQENLPP